MAHACRIRLRPILMTSLATVVGLLPMAFKLETGSEAYAPLARVIIGGLLTSIVLTIFVVPAAYLLIYRRSRRNRKLSVSCGVNRDEKAISAVASYSLSLRSFRGSPTAQNAPAAAASRQRRLQASRKRSPWPTPRKSRCRIIPRSRPRRIWPPRPSSRSARCAPPTIRRPTEASPAPSRCDSRIAAGGLNNPDHLRPRIQRLTASASSSPTSAAPTSWPRAPTCTRRRSKRTWSLASRRALAVDQAYFGVLRAQAVLQVAQETVKDRQTGLRSNHRHGQEPAQIRSGRQLRQRGSLPGAALLIQAQNDVQASFAELSTAWAIPISGPSRSPKSRCPPAPPPILASLIQQALQNRPELVGQRLDVNSAQTYATAERDLYFPTVSALGSRRAHARLTRRRSTTATPPPASTSIFPSSTATCSAPCTPKPSFRAQAEQQNLRDLQDRIVRDVRTAWLNANSGFQRLSVTEQLLSQATMAMNLAQSRYNLGLSSIVELTQAQLNLTQAQITEASAKYDYEAETSQLNYQIGMVP